MQLIPIWWRWYYWGSPMAWTLWAYDLPSGWQDYSNWGTWKRLCYSEILPKVPLGLWIWLPWSCCCGPYWLFPPFLLWLCLWHQVPQLPKEIKRTQALTMIRFCLTNWSSLKIWLTLYFIFTNFVNQHPINDLLF